MKNHQGLERVFCQPCSYLLSAQASGNSASGIRRPGFHGQGLSALQPHLSHPHTLPVLTARDVHRELAHCCTACQGAALSFPKNALTAARNEVNIQEMYCFS